MEEEEIGKELFIQTYKTSSCNAQEYHQETNEKFKKMRTAKNNLDKMLWPNVNKEDFKVVCMEKEMAS